MTNKLKGWEGEFDKFTVDKINKDKTKKWLFQTGVRPSDISSFISSLLDTQKQAIIEIGRGMRPILWNDDKNRYLENVSRRNTLDEYEDRINKEI